MVSINKEKCIGCGLCVSICSEGFELGDDGKAKIKNKNAKCIQETKNQCPVNAIE